MDYIGWIPCLNGHLDFGLMRVGIQGGFTDKSFTDDHTIEINESVDPKGFADSHQRLIVLQSKVDWRDQKTHPVENGYFRVIVTAKVEASPLMDERSLKGHVLIYPLKFEPENVEERKKMEVHSVCHTMSADNPQENFKKLELITSGNKPVAGLSGKGFSCSLSFTVHPNGLVQLNDDKNQLDDRSLFIFSRQAFYYLKYSLHVHNHHIDEQDSLTTITSLTGDKDSASAAGLRLICQLKRELTSIKRVQNFDNKEHPTSNALGIIAYTKSLITSLKDVGYLTSDIEKRELARFEYIKNSFDAQSSKLGNEISNTELVKSKSKVWFGFLLISIWSGFNFFFKSYSDLKQPVDRWEAFYLFGLSALLLYFFYMAIQRYYEARYSAKASVHLYDISYLKLATKIIAPVALSVLILKFFVL